ncbi:ATP-binding protein [Saccharopolyspora sp. NFXS83]|uniref:ATP-binding protein n=1 Tax=Saccharopolyspora sp. NFXS83 TaxID=2993560 RepID=UPI00224ADCC1|nr:ATP-binding protein [Saccharopolyspora sp. NFXS83]MCX2731847.1 ATP-binding protein [Saccharopolyspora sp. NFXS83]
MSAPTHTQSAAKRRHLARALLVLLISGVVTAALSTWAAVASPDSATVLVAWSTGIAAALISIAFALASWGLQNATFYRTRAEKADGATAKLADETLPALVTRLRAGSSVDTALGEIDHPRNPTHQRILRALGQEIGQGERARAAAMLACANAAGRMQALSTNMLASLREMEERHDESVLGDLLELDHTTAQAGRLADSIAVLTGARSGRRWTKPIKMESILRGSVGRIAAYKRVRLHSTSTVAIVGYAAEGVMHALAELMDNATSFSPPSELAHVYVEEVHSGVIVTIEDGGLVMSEAAMKRAVHAVGTEPLDLTTLNGTRLGLAVVGCLARKHGLTVSFRPSSRGGTGVVVMIPRKLITQPRKQEEFTLPSRTVGAAQPAQLSSVTSAGTATATGTLTRQDLNEKPAAPAENSEATLQNLPKRRRGETLAAASPSLVSGSDDDNTQQQPPAPARPRPNAGARFGAFRQASRPSDGSQSDDAR